MAKKKTFQVFPRQYQSVYSCLWGTLCSGLMQRIVIILEEASLAKRIERKIEALQRGKVATFDLRPMRKRGGGSDGEFDMRPMKRNIDAYHIRPMKRGGDVDNDNRLCYNGRSHCLTKDPVFNVLQSSNKGPLTGCLINNRLISNLVKLNEMHKVWPTIR